MDLQVICRAALSDPTHWVAYAAMTTDKVRGSKAPTLLRQSHAHTRLALLQKVAMPHSLHVMNFTGATVRRQQKQLRWCTMYDTSSPVAGRLSFASMYLMDTSRVISHLSASKGPVPKI